MPAPSNLTDVYTDELGDMWSANDQMAKLMPEFAEAASDPKLKKKFEKSQKGIEKHTEAVKKLLQEMGEEDAKEHCKGMEGLVKEARKHALKAKIKDGDVRDVVLIEQYQRMCHYGICGFGCAKAFAEALGKRKHVEKLEKILSEIYSADDFMTDLAERSVNLEAKAQAGAG